MASLRRLSFSAGSLMHKWCYRHSHFPLHPRSEDLVCPLAQQLPEASPVHAASISKICRKDGSLPLVCLCHFFHPHDTTSVSSLPQDSSNGSSSESQLLLWLTIQGPIHSLPSFLEAACLQWYRTNSPVCVLKEALMGQHISPHPYPEIPLAKDDANSVLPHSEHDTLPVVCAWCMVGVFSPQSTFWPDLLGLPQFPSHSTLTPGDAAITPGSHFFLWRVEGQVLFFTNYLGATGIEGRSPEHLCCPLQYELDEQSTAQWPSCPPMKQAPDGTGQSPLTWRELADQCCSLIFIWWSSGETSGEAVGWTQSIAFLAFSTVPCHELR